MILWLDAQLSPATAGWITERLGLEALSVRDVGLLSATDNEIYLAARGARAVIVTKDRDFLRLIERHGTPPKVILDHIREHLEHTLKGTTGTRVARRAWTT